MTMTELPPYSGGFRDCPKCGFSSVKITYHAAHFTHRTCDVEDFFEHLVRSCPACGYQWAEACADNDAAGRLKPVPGGEGDDECPG